MYQYYITIEDVGIYFVNYAGSRYSREWMQEVAVVSVDGQSIEFAVKAPNDEQAVKLAEAMWSVLTGIRFD